MNSIAIFNNKGGVGKTTLLCNIAAYYSIHQHKKVLVIDSDPQCNATTYLLDDTKLEEVYSDKSVKTLYDYIEPYQSGEDLINLPIQRSDNFSVDLVLGDIRLALMEDFLSGEWADTASAIQRSLKTICFFKRLFLDVQKKYDFVFIDVGPSLGVLNRLVLLFSDGFIMPTSSDIFCLRAINNISTAIDQWVTTFNELQNRYFKKKGCFYKLDDMDVNVNPKFLGYVNQQYTSRTRGGKRQAVKAYDDIISQMPELVKEKLCKYYPENIDINHLKVGEIPNFNSLLPMSQSAHRPVFELGSRDGVLGAHFAKVDEYRKVMSDITNNINRNLVEYGLA
jgi:cellulose biosynthesis protein BcsQ